MLALAAELGDRVTTGMFLNNFMNWFDSIPESPNAVGPHNRIAMCMSQCQVWKDGNPFAAIGTFESHGILQTTYQMVLNLIEHGMNVQAAIEAPRVRLKDPGTHVSMEGRIPATVRAALEARGHEIEVLPDWTATVGGGQGIAFDTEEGVLWAGLIHGLMGMR